MPKISGPIKTLSNQITALQEMDMVDGVEGLGIVKLKLVNIGQNFLVEGTWKGLPIPTGYWPLSGPGQTFLDIDLSFTGVANGGFVELDFELGADVPARFIPDYEITAGHQSSSARLFKIQNDPYSEKHTRILCKRINGGIGAVPYNVGIYVRHNNNFEMPTFLDPKIKNNG